MGGAEVEEFRNRWCRRGDNCQEITTQDGKRPTWIRMVHADRLVNRGNVFSIWETGKQEKETETQSWEGKYEVAVLQ